MEGEWSYRTPETHLVNSIDPKLVASLPSKPFRVIAETVHGHGLNIYTVCTY